MLSVEDFKKRFSLEQRYLESQRMFMKHPSRIPVIINSAHEDIYIQKKKYLVPSDIYLAEFIHLLRKKLVVGREQTLLVFCENKLPVVTNSMLQVYAQHKDKDGFLYLTLTFENTFGN